MVCIDHFRLILEGEFKVDVLSAAVVFVGCADFADRTVDVKVCAL